MYCKNETPSAVFFSVILPQSTKKTLMNFVFNSHCQFNKTANASHSCWHFQRMALQVADILGLSVFKTINETLFVIICLWNHEIKLWYTKSMFVCKLFLHNQDLSSQKLILRYILTLWRFLSISDIITLSCCLATTYFQYLCTYKSIIHI